MAIDPEELLRSALEKIVFFECRVSQLESELLAARTTAERARADAAAARRHEVELEQTAAAERGARGDLQARADDLGERVRLLEGERERLLAGLVERARVGGAPGSDGAPGPEEGGADLAGFIAELRAEIVALRAWKAAAEVAGYRGEPGATVVRLPVHESVPALAGRFESEGRVGLSGRDTDRMKGLLGTQADRVLYERSMDDLKAADARTRLRAVRALEALGSKAAAPLLAAALGREADEGVKAAILGALARFKEPFAAELAARELGDARPAVRIAALETLAAVAQDSSEARLAEAMADPSPLVRRRAALLLAFTQGERSEAALAAALGDPDRGVARAAAAALSGRPTARAQGALARALEHPEASVREAAGRALSRVSGEAVPVDGPAPARRAASRRIAEKLAAMDAPALREAVLAATATPFAAAVRPSAPVAAPVRPSTPARASVPAQPTTRACAQDERMAVRPAAGVTTAVRAEPFEELRAGGGARRVEAPARTAVAVMVQEAAPAAGTDLEAVVAEVRMSLRGCTAADLGAVLGLAGGQVEAALATLSARGTIVQRGARWFMA
ncbi:MAG: HEAT repeat domain-containing protein [Anaeromyxobacter sp.]